MSRRPALVTQADVARAIRAADQCRPQRTVEITREGVIRLVPAEAKKPEYVEPEALDDEPKIEL